MAGPSSQTLQPDAFVDHSRNHHTPDTLSLLNAADASALEAAVGEINRRNFQSNQSINLSYADLQHAPSRETDNTGDDTMSSKPPARSGQLQFRSQTIAPSPPLPESRFEDTPELEDPPYQPSPLANSNNSPLHVSTDVRSTPQTQIDSIGSHYGLSALSRSGGLALQHNTSSSSSSSLRPISRTPSFKQAIANSIGSACSSVVPSPIISAMGELTPLPSPLIINDSPGPWMKLGLRPPSRDSALHSMMADSALVTMSGESVSSVLANQSRRKAYAGLKGVETADNDSGDKAHGRNRSVSEYVPDPMSIPKRLATVSGSHPRVGEGGLNGTAEQHLRREPHLSAARGLVPATKPPTPPPSESSQSNDGPSGQESAKKSKLEYFEAHGRNDQKLRRWRAIRQLGEGTFSRVMLATSQVNVDEDESTEASTGSEPSLKTLVAVKVCEHGPRGGASETRIEMSLKRELEIMQSVHHPSLVHLKAWNIEPTRALLVLSYCPGGDLFDVATRHRKLLTPPLLRRIFAELVGAVRYLHERRIVHRDIKLENVLVNVPSQQLENPQQDWATYPDSIITLTDLGLSRRVADDEKLETRCGSDDYAAPEVILGQPYDGRAIDAWSMGVLLYALLESRLPFDPPPNASDAHRMRSRTSHRIARVEWMWVEYSGDDGDHDADEAKFEAQGLKGAMEVTEGLLKRARSRWPMEKVAAHEWVRDGIKVEGGPKFKEEEEGAEVL